MARDVSKVLGLSGLVTHKTSTGQVELTENSIQLPQTLHTPFVLVLEDVGTTGSTTLAAAESALKLGAEKVAILFTWQRTDELSTLKGKTIQYKAIIKEPLPSYASEQCHQEGYCAMGWNLIRRS